MATVYDGDMNMKPSITHQIGVVDKDVNKECVNEQTLPGNSLLPIQGGTKCSHIHAPRNGCIVHVVLPDSEKHSTQR